MSARREGAPCEVLSPGGQTRHHRGMSDNVIPSEDGGGSGRGDWMIPRGLVVVLSGAAVVIGVAGIRAFSSVIAPFFLALMIVIGVDPLMRWLIRKGTPRIIAGIVALAVSYAIIIGLAVALVVSVARLATLLPEYTEQFNDLVDEVEQLLADQGVSSERIDDALSSFDWTQVVDVVQTLLSSLLDIFSNIAFILALMFFLAIDAMSFDRRLEIAERARPDVIAALRGFASGTRTYLVVSTVFGLIVAVIDTIALSIMGIPLPLLWGLLAFITNYIPNIGFVVGVIPPALLGLLEGGWDLMLAVIIVYSVINFVIQSLIQPKFVGDAVGLTVTVTFLSLVFWAWVLGALGALLAIPLTLLTKALLIDIDPRTRWINSLIVSKPGGRDSERPSAAEQVTEIVEEHAEDVEEVAEDAAESADDVQRVAPVEQ